MGHGQGHQVYVAQVAQDAPRTGPLAEGRYVVGTTVVGVIMHWQKMSCLKRVGRGMKLISSEAAYEVKVPL